MFSGPANPAFDGVTSAVAALTALAAGAALSTAAPGAGLDAVAAARAVSEGVPAVPWPHAWVASSAPRATQVQAQRVAIPACRAISPAVSHGPAAWSGAGAMPPPTPKRSDISFSVSHYRKT